MSGSNHTPGPWKPYKITPRIWAVTKSNVTLAICLVSSPYSDPSDEVLEANAKFISRAPEMLELLHDVNECLDGYADASAEDSAWVPNSAMAMQGLVRELLKDMGEET